MSTIINKPYDWYYFPYMWETYAFLEPENFLLKRYAQYRPNDWAIKRQLKRYCSMDYDERNRLTYLKVYSDGEKYPNWRWYRVSYHDDDSVALYQDYKGGYYRSEWGVPFLNILDLRDMHYQELVHRDKSHNYISNLLYRKPESKNNLPTVPHLIFNDIEIELPF